MTYFTQSDTTTYKIGYDAFSLYKNKRERLTRIMQHNMFVEFYC